ncbi:MAG TPA: hypothetical protein DCS28_02400 [Candidatus Moranbacteria bacterium]|nr:hypothetical protein [Candidatus Moranbacteria bacterium]HAT74865.1 hypothetical protein [Candidatus Moranbacteria bacterium]
MSGCNCARCPHSCGDEKEPEKNGNKQIPEESNDDSSEETKITANKKIEKLKQAILNLGFKLEDTKKGIRVSM